MENMAEIMKTLSDNPPKKVGNTNVSVFDDYKKRISKDCVTGKTTPITLPASNVLTFKLEDGNMAVIRPSGTEPKIKIYYFVKEKDEVSAKNREESLNNDFIKLLGL